MAPDPSPKGDQRVAYGSVADGRQRNADATANLPPDLVAEARRCPGGWVYEIHPEFDRYGAVPPHAIRGAWKVDDEGNLTGEYVANEKYRP